MTRNVEDCETSSKTSIKSLYYIRHSECSVLSALHGVIGMEEKPRTASYHKWYLRAQLTLIEMLSVLLRELKDSSNTLKAATQSELKSSGAKWCKLDISFAT